MACLMCYVSIILDFLPRFPMFHIYIFLFLLGSVWLLVPFVLQNGFADFFVFVPQQLKKLGILLIKLRGGLGQPPETLDEVPRGSA